MNIESPPSIFHVPNSSKIGNQNSRKMPQAWLWRKDSHGFPKSTGTLFLSQPGLVNSSGHCKWCKMDELWNLSETREPKKHLMVWYGSSSLKNHLMCLILPNCPKKTNSSSPFCGFTTVHPKLDRPNLLPSRLHSAPGLVLLLQR